MFNSDGRLLAGLSRAEDRQFIQVDFLRKKPDVHRFELDAYGKAVLQKRDDLVSNPLIKKVALKKQVQCDRSDHNQGQSRDCGNLDQPKHKFLSGPLLIKDHVNRYFEGRGESQFDPWKW